MTGRIERGVNGLTLTRAEFTGTRHSDKQVGAVEDFMRGRGMKQIKDNKHLSIKQTAWDGGAGIIRLPRNNKTGFTKATIIWSWGMDWEHVSLSPLNGTMPTWDDMCFIKDMFWNEEDCVIQYHPPKSEYVNNMPNCLHLWKPIKETIPMPPSILTGIK